MCSLGKAADGRAADGRVTQADHVSHNHNSDCMRLASSSGQSHVVSIYGSGSGYLCQSQLATHSAIGYRISIITALIPLTNMTAEK